MVLCLNRADGANAGKTNATDIFSDQHVACHFFSRRELVGFPLTRVTLIYQTTHTLKSPSPVHVRGGFKISMTIDISKNRAAAFAANNVGVELLRKGQFAKSLVAFQNAAHMLNSSRASTTSNSTPCRVLDVPIIPWATPAPDGQTYWSTNVHLVEYNELALTLGVDETDSKAYAIRIDYVPREGSKQMVFYMASVLYNFGMSYLMCFTHLKHERESSRGSKLLRLATLLFGSTKAILFNEILAGSSLEEGHPVVASLQLARFTLTGIATIYRLQMRTTSLPSEMRDTQNMVDHCLQETLYFTTLLEYRHETACAA